MRLMSGIFAAFGVIALTGCAKPPYSYDVRGNGEGGVVVTTVPYREEPWRQTPPPEIVYVHDAPTTMPATQPAPPPTIVYLPATAPAPVVPSPSVADLEARLKELAAENAKLKAQLQNSPTTVPATNP
jgi:hypothetical protein